MPQYDRESRDSDEVEEEYREAIESYYRPRKKVDIVNIELRRDEKDFEEVKLVAIEEYNRNINHAIKANASRGFILRNRESGKMHYFHSSINNLPLLENSVVVRDAMEFKQFLSSFLEQDLLEGIRLQRPNSQWVVQKLTIITLYLYKMNNSHPT